MNQQKSPPVKKRTDADLQKNTTKLLALVALWLFTQTGIGAAEIFHWTDASGIFHFTDNPYSILEDVRNSSMLIVHKDLQPAPRFLE